MKHGSITSLQNQNDHHLSGLRPVNHVRSVQRHNSQLGRLWLQYFGIIFIDYLEKGKTINSDYYTALLDRLKAEIVKKRRQIVKKKFCFTKTMHHVTSQYCKIALRIASSSTI